MMARRALHRCQLGKCQDYLVPANPLLLEGEHSCRGAGACRLIREYIYFLFALSMQHACRIYHIQYSGVLLPGGAVVLQLPHFHIAFCRLIIILCGVRARSEGCAFPRAILQCQSQHTQHTHTHSLNACRSHFMSCRKVRDGKWRTEKVKGSARAQPAVTSIANK